MVVVLKEDVLASQLGGGKGMASGEGERTGPTIRGAGDGVEETGESVGGERTELTVGSTGDRVEGIGGRDGREAGVFAGSEHNRSGLTGMDKGFVELTGGLGECDEGIGIVLGGGGRGIGTAGGAGSGAGGSTGGGGTWGMAG